jgi:hypothetical protein
MIDLIKVTNEISKTQSDFVDKDFNIPIHTYK